VIAACATVGIEETITESGFSIYPNPFTGQLSIEFYLPQTSIVSIQIFNAMGAKVAELHHGQLPAGQQQFTWHAGDLPKGMYFCRVQVGKEMAEHWNSSTGSGFSIPAILTVLTTTAMDLWMI
jgi:hypothetical protein